MSIKFFQAVKDSRLVRVLRNKYLLVTLFFVVWIVFFDSNNLISWYSDIRTVIMQERQKNYYREAIKVTDEKLKELSSNRDSLEKFAREQYFFHEKDEELFIIHKTQNENK